MKKVITRLILMVACLSLLMGVMSYGFVAGAIPEAHKPLVVEEVANNTIADATLVSLKLPGRETYNEPTEIYAGIHDLDDVDYYRINLDVSGKLNIDVKSYISPTYSIVVYDLLGEELWYADENTRDPSAFSAHESKHAVDLEKGYYAIMVKGSAHSFGKKKATGNYYLTFKFDPSKETYTNSNNSYDGASFISRMDMSDWTYGQLAENDGYDYFKFTFQTRQRLTLDFSANLEFYSIVLYDDRQDPVWYTDENQWDSYKKLQEATYIFDLENGVYYLEIAGKIHVDRNYPSKYTGNYKFYTQINSSAVGTNTSEVLNFSNLENMNFDEKTGQYIVQPSYSGGSGGGGYSGGGGGTVGDYVPVDPVESIDDGFISEVPSVDDGLVADPPQGAGNTASQATNTDRDGGGFPKWILILVVALILVVLGVGAFLIIRQRSYNYDDYDYEDYEDGYDGYDSYEPDISEEPIEPLPSPDTPTEGMID